MTSVLSQYLKIYSEYHAKYGDKAVVLMQVGSFFTVGGAVASSLTIHLKRV